jgi:hypothetical protein
VDAASLPLIGQILAPESSNGGHALLMLLKQPIFSLRRRCLKIGIFDYIVVVAFLSHRRQQVCSFPLKTRAFSLPT